MKRLREIILDFTPLLDVTLIILFYFIMFSHMGAAEVQAKAEKAIADANAAQAEASEAIQEATAKAKEAEARKNAYEEADNHAAEIGDALVEFDSNNNLQLILSGENDNQKLVIKQGNKIVETVEESILKAEDAALANALLSSMDKIGYTEDNIILCTFIFNSNNFGSHKAIDNIENALEAIKKNYNNLYISDNDLNENDK